MRRCCGDPSSSRFSEAWVKAWKVALLVSVCPGLQERVIVLCRIIQVSVDIRLKNQPSLINLQSKYF